MLVLLFPVLSFIASIDSGNVVNEMRYEWLRLRSFSTFPLSFPISLSPIRLAQSGFYFTGRNQECVCFSCGIHNSDWTGNNVTEIHRQLSPDCRHLQGPNDTNIPIGSRESYQSRELHSESTSCRGNNEHNTCRGNSEHNSCRGNNEHNSCRGNSEHNSCRGNNEHNSCRGNSEHNSCRGNNEHNSCRGNNEHNSCRGNNEHNSCRGNSEHNSCRGNNEHNSCRGNNEHNSCRGNNEHNSCRGNNEHNSCRGNNEHNSCRGNNEHNSCRGNSEHNSCRGNNEHNSCRGNNEHNSCRGNNEHNSCRGNSEHNSCRGNNEHNSCRGNNEHNSCRGNNEHNSCRGNSEHNSCRGNNEHNSCRGNNEHNSCRGNNEHNSCRGNSEHNSCRGNNEHVRDAQQRQSESHDINSPNRTNHQNHALPNSQTNVLRETLQPLGFYAGFYFQNGFQFQSNHINVYPISEQSNSLDTYFSAPVNSVNVVNEMCYEWLRLRSFSTFPLTSLSLIRLAQSGFYFTGRNQECVCFLCGIHNSDWTGNDVTEIHRQLSPDCRHLQGRNDTNIPIRARESGQSNELHSETNSRRVNNEHVVFDAQQRQSANSPNRTNHQNHTSPNSQADVLRETRGVVMERPRYPSDSVLVTSVSSFQERPPYLTQTPRNLSTTGFFYVGYGDYVVQEEESEDIPPQEQTEHVRDIEQLPAAREIRQMGYTWATIKEAYRKLNRNREDVSTAELIEEILTGDVPASSSEPVVNNNQDIPPVTSVDPSLHIRNETNGAFTSIATTMIEGTMRMSEETQSLMEENRRPREEILCRICMEEDIAIVFLPCGHLCCYTHCAPAMGECPIYQSVIKGTKMC